MKIITKNPYQTKKAGEKLAMEILSPAFLNLNNEHGIIIGLVGDLGGGKTTFLQGFAKGLGIKEKITSPTFVLMKKFRIMNKLSMINYQYFYHLDCYRIQKPEDIFNIGFKEIISESKNIIAIEWSNRIEEILPKYTIKIKFEFKNKNTRKIIWK